MDALLRQGMGPDVQALLQYDQLIREMRQGGTLGYSWGWKVFGVGRPCMPH